MIRLSSVNVPGVLQYAQTCFEGLKAYTTEDGHIVMLPPGLKCKATC